MVTNAVRAIKPAAVDSKIVCSLQSKRFRQVFRTKKSISVFWMRTDESSFLVQETQRKRLLRRLKNFETFLRLKCSWKVSERAANADVFP